MLIDRLDEQFGTALVIPLDEAAPLLRYTPASLRIAVRAGRVPGVKVGGRWMISTGYIRNLLTPSETTASAQEAHAATSTP